LSLPGAETFPLALAPFLPFDNDFRISTVCFFFFYFAGVPLLRTCYRPPPSLFLATGSMIDHLLFWSFPGLAFFASTFSPETFWPLSPLSRVVPNRSLDLFYPDPFQITHTFPFCGQGCLSPGPQYAPFPRVLKKSNLTGKPSSPPFIASVPPICPTSTAGSPLEKVGNFLPPPQGLSSLPRLSVPSKQGNLSKPRPDCFSTRPRPPLDGPPFLWLYLVLPEFEIARRSTFGGGVFLLLCHNSYPSSLRFGPSWGFLATPIPPGSYRASFSFRPSHPPLGVF